MLAACDTFYLNNIKNIKIGEFSYICLIMYTCVNVFKKDSSFTFSVGRAHSTVVLQMSNWNYV